MEYSTTNAFNVPIDTPRTWDGTQNTGQQPRPVQTQRKEIRIPLTPLKPMYYHIQRKLVKSAPGRYSVLETRELQLQNQEEQQQMEKEEQDQLASQNGMSDFSTLAKRGQQAQPEFTMTQTINTNLMTKHMDTSLFMEGRDGPCNVNPADLDIGFSSFFDHENLDQPMLSMDNLANNGFIAQPNRRLLRATPNTLHIGRQGPSNYGNNAMIPHHQPTPRELVAIYDKQEKELAAKLQRVRALKEKAKRDVRRQNEEISPEQLSMRKSKKLKPNTYEALFSKVCDSGELKSMYLKSDHPKPKDLGDLAGVIYFLFVDKTAKRPPQVGFQFRSYSDCHYTSVNRDDPMICKVKQWQSLEANKEWRLYHFYRGNKSTRKRKRTPEEEEASKRQKGDPASLNMPGN